MEGDGGGKGAMHKLDVMVYDMPIHQQFPSCERLTKFIVGCSNTNLLEWCLISKSLPIIGYPCTMDGLSSPLIGRANGWDT